MLVGFVVLLLLRGAGDKRSIIGVKRCDRLEWGLLSILIAENVYFRVDHDWNRYFDTKERLSA